MARGWRRRVETVDSATATACTSGSGGTAAEFESASEVPKGRAACLRSVIWQAGLLPCAWCIHGENPPPTRPIAMPPNSSAARFESIAGVIRAHLMTK